MAFTEIVGNSRMKRVLRKALSRERLPHALLFCGSPGVGKTDTALVTAKALNCLNKSDDACETCAACVAINRGNFPDVIRISPEKEVLVIERMRELKELAYLKPMVGKKRVFVIEQAEKMNASAANSLLKVLEEPPLFTHILLISDNPYLILPTIKSRCQVLNFAPVSREEIERRLTEDNLEAQHVRIISRLVKGNLRQALSLDWDDIREKRERAWDLLGALAAGENAADLLKLYSSKQRGQIAEEILAVMEFLLTLCRDLVLVKEGAARETVMNPDLTDRICGLGERLTRAQAQKLWDRVDGAIAACRRGMNVKIMISSLFMESLG